MNDEGCRILIEEYVDWLRSGFAVRSVENGCELVTPFLDRHNDNLQVYVERKGDSIIITDDGYILADLEASGLTFTSDKRKKTLQAILTGTGVKLKNDELWVEADGANAGQKLHLMVQAMLAINDMYVLAQPYVPPLFRDEVKEFLDQHDIHHTPRVEITGRSGYDQTIDFVIPKSPNRPERIIKAINNPRANTTQAYLFALADIHEAREEPADAYAFLNDRERPVPRSVTEALEKYKVTPVLWSRRDEFVPDLAA